MKKTLFILAFALIFFVATTAMAKVNFGVKYLSLTHAYDIIEIEHVYTVAGNQTLNFYMGFDATPQVAIVSGLEVDRASYEYKDDQTDVTTAFSATSFTPNVGVKFYFKERTDNSVCPYIYGGFFKTFTSVNIEDEEEEAKFLGKLHSPFGFIPAFGAEYCFTENFSLGGEMGFRFSFAKGEWEQGDDPKYKDEATFNTIFHYIALTLNFRF